MKDELGDRMKTYYEDRSRMYLPRRSNVMIRIDGKAFHTYTKGLVRPFDTDLHDDMNATMKFLCESIQGAKLGYVQSDEISILITDYDKTTTDAWFDYNVQKMTSIAASMATSQFNKLRMERALSSAWKNYVYGAGQDDPDFFKFDFTVSFKDMKMAHFDARAFTLPTQDEVINYFIWRQQDATRNSIQAVAQSLYSHNELNGKSSDDLQELIFLKGKNWNDFPAGQKRGRTAIKRFVTVPTTEEIYEKAKDKSSFVIDYTGDTQRYGIRRKQWVIEEPPIFTQDKDYIRNPILSSLELV